MREEANAAVLELLLTEEAGRERRHGGAAGVVVGTFAGLDDGGPRVRLPGGRSDGGIPARSIVDLEQGQVGREVVLAFEGGDPARPIVLGVIRAPDEITPEIPRLPESLSITAARDIVLRCGKASITLTRAGKILLRGAYLLSRSSGANRIKGGSVQIN